MIRIGLLLDSTHIQAWQAEALRQILRTGYAEIALLILNQFPKSSGKPSPFFYKVYRKIDRILFKVGEDAFETVRISEVLNIPIPTLEVKPIQKKYRDIFPKETIDEIAQYDLDVLLRFGFRILSGDILKVAKQGVWSYHHGDPAIYRGGPPAFWEVMKSLPVSSAALLKITENLDKGEILYQSFTQTTPLSVQRNANKLFWLSAYFVSRVILKIHHSGWENWNASLSESTAYSPLLKPPGNLEMMKLGIDLALKNLSRKKMELRKKPHWSIGQIPLSLHEGVVSVHPSITKVWEHPDPDHFFWADPFPIEIEGCEFLFVEEFDKKRQKGRIVCLEFEDAIIKVNPVLEEPWHLSYPFIWKEQEDIFLIPESGESGKLYLYKSLEFPSKWEKLSLLLDQEGYDPTLFKQDGVYWLFVNQKPHPECSPFDELNLFYSEDLLKGSWIPHPQNPIVSDVRRSRPAGKLFIENGKLYRPAQDSGIRYGHRIHIQEIHCLTKDNYVESTVQTIESEPDFVQGIHTYNKGKEGTWIDLYKRI